MESNEQAINQELKDQPTVQENTNGQQEKKVKETELTVCQAELIEWKDKYLRLSADFQNFKKRLQKEQASLRRMMQADILADVLNIVDNFDRALQEKEAETENMKDWFAGFELIRKELYKLLEKYGVKELESYDVFDPEMHEAVMQVDSDQHESGGIVEVYQKGYIFDGSVLRPAKVSVAK
ncbi:MAG: nucleotide exchange factor GrpE [Candidatus Babeliales bacterium]